MGYINASTWAKLTMVDRETSSCQPEKVQIDGVLAKSWQYPDKIEHSRYDDAVVPIKCFLD